MTTVRWLDPNAAPSPVTRFVLEVDGNLIDVGKPVPDAQGVYAASVTTPAAPVPVLMYAFDVDDNRSGPSNTITIPEPGLLLMLITGCLLLALLNWRRNGDNEQA